MCDAFNNTNDKIVNTVCNGNAITNNLTGKIVCDVLANRNIFDGSTVWDCRVVGATYANGWLIIVGASKTSPVPRSGMRRRHARRRILPRFGAHRGDNNPSPALRGLRMITRSE